MITPNYDRFLYIRKLRVHAYILRERTLKFTNVMTINVVIGKLNRLQCLYYFAEDYIFTI